MPRTLSPPVHVPIVDDAPMRFDHTVDRFIQAKRQRGDINSPTSERLYRSVLDAHAYDVGQRDPATTTREHILVTLSRWDNPNTASKRLSVLKSFYKWCVQEGVRKDNPADQVPAIRSRPTSVYRLSRDEVRALLGAARTTREKRIVFLGTCAGLRNSELRGLRGSHFAREGYIYVSPSIAKGGKGRWVPVIRDLEPVVAEIRENVADSEFVIPARRWAYVVGPKRRQIDHPHLPSSPQSLKTAIEQLGKRAGIHAHMHPHLMRHAFGDHIAKAAGLKAAQELLGHSDVSTTQGTYTGRFTPDELSATIAGFSFLDEQAFPTPPNYPETPREAPTRIELVLSPGGLILPDAVYRKAGRDGS